MALAEQIEAADIAARRRPVVDVDGMHREAILAMPVQERDAAIRELERARSCVLRVAAPEHTAELLDKLGLAPSDDAGRAIRSYTDTAAEKECRRCRAVKPRTDFYRAKRHRDGLASYCKVCHYELRKEYRKSKRDGGHEAAS